MHVGRTRRTARTVVVAASLVSGTLALSVVAGSTARADLNDDKRKVQSQITALQEDMDHTSAALAKANAALQDSQSRLPGAQNALAAAQQAQAAADARNEQAKVDLAKAKADQAQAAADLQATQKALADTRSAVAGFAAQLYTEQGSGTLAIALETSDPQALADRMSMTDVLSDLQNSTLEELSTSNASLLADQDYLAATKAKVAAAQAATEAALADATSAANAAAVAKATLESLIAQQSAATTTLATEKAAEKKRYADLTAESDRITAKLAAIAAEEKRKAEEERRRKAAEQAAAEEAASNNNGNNNGGTTGSNPTSNPPPVNDGGFLSAPVRTGWVSSEFGWRMHPILNYLRLHAGRDYAAPCGTPIYAAAPGTVVSAGWGGGYGNQVIISHGLVGGEALATTYNHMERIVAGYGAISRGQLVGYVGTTGLSTGCHLHFEARVNGAPQDPRRWL